MAIVFRDISEARATSLRMSHLASHDPLTDLPNRLLLSDRLARALALAHRHQRRLAVLFLDIDRFKYINDSLGHLLGDELLRAVGREVTMCVRSSDTVSRHGGDEFVVVLSELEHAEDAAVGAQKIIAALARPFTLAGHELHITVSIGISVYPDDGEDAETLLKSADMALYHAKDQGRDCYQFFKPDLNVRAVERQSIEAGLHSALDRREFELFYQPKMNLKTGAMVGAEALIRWRHPDRGLVEPAQFVPIAEDCGLIRPIGRWVVHEACRQAQAWQDAGLRPIPVSVNISALEFRNKGFLKNVVDTLNETCLDPRYLEIELTESVLMAQRRGHQLRAPRAQEPGGAAGDRRLWNGLVQLELPETPSNRRAESRQVVRAGDHLRFRRGSHRQRRDQHGQEPQASGDCGGRGNTRPARIPSGRRLL